MPALSEIRFRSSPRVELKQLSELTAEQREPFLELANDPGFHGLFVPRSPLSMNLKAVEHQTAELFRTLLSPSHLDQALLADDEYAGDVVDLVLDGILEIESGGDFVSGADAFPLLCSGLDAGDAVAGLSRDALLHAQDLETADPRVLTMALYFYNRIPMSPFWKARFANETAILAVLGADRDALRILLEREWVASHRTPGWLSWSPRMPVRRNAGDRNYKLYISPRPERIREAFQIVVRVLAAFPGTHFKIGDSAAGLLRPDKMVAYFPTREVLDEAAAALHRELAGCEAHGVPFTASLDDSGLLFWGVDPPDDDRALQWLQRESWRLWVAQRLGAAMAIAKSARSASAGEPWRFAVERARRHGVDIETWTPSARLWSKA